MGFGGHADAAVKAIDEGARRWRTNTILSCIYDIFFLAQRAHSNNGPYNQIQFAGQYFQRQALYGVECQDHRDYNLPHWPY